ncbi:MAG: hypothetical protein R3326_10005 [Gemmatimonadota bacterium]|nr:hypothetical protein [Gemmatimonadota bacterium]
MENDTDPRAPDPSERSPDAPNRGDASHLGFLLFAHPDRIHPKALLWADGRVLAASDPGRRTVVGWHRDGGAVLLAVTTDTATETSLLEAFHLAAVEGGAALDRWADALESFWEDADPELRSRIERRWNLSDGKIASPAAWAERAWNVPPEPGPARTGIVAARVPVPLRRTIDWLSERGVEVAAWQIERAPGGDPTGFRFERVAGRWRGSELETHRLPGIDEELRRKTYVRHTGAVTAALLAELESTCRASGATVAWSGEEWVRFDGATRSLRVFPGTDGIDLQFVGADEGTLIGLRFRYGVPVGADPPPGAPPGVHLRLVRPEDFGPEVRLLVKAWLGGHSDETVRDPGPVRKDRKVAEREEDEPPGRARGRRNRSR